MATDTEIVATELKQATREIVATDTEVVATKVNAENSIILDALKKKKGEIEGEFDNLLRANGKEWTIKRRIIKKVLHFERCFYQYKDQLTDAFIYEISGRLWLFNMTQQAKTFQKELDALKEAENVTTKDEPITIEFDDVVYSNGKYQKSTKRVGETVNN